MKQNMGTTTSALLEHVLYLCACAAWAAKGDLDGVMPQFEGHKECAVFMGNTPEQVAELCHWLCHVMNAE